MEQTPRSITVKDLLHNIKLLKDKWLITDDTPLIYSHDDEGNAYQWVVFVPQVMYLNRPLKIYRLIDPNEIITLDDIQYENKDSVSTVLCIN